MFQGSLEHKGKAALRLYCCWGFFQLKQKYFAQRVKRQSAAENLECEETRECSMNGNTGHGRWTYHHTARHKSGSNVPLFFFFFFFVRRVLPVLLRGGQPAQRPGSWSETAWLTSSNEIAWIPSASSFLHCCITTITPAEVEKKQSREEKASLGFLFLYFLEIVSV